MKTPSPLLAYFTSPSAAAAFALLHMQGDEKMEILEITRAHYRDAALADEWHRTVRGRVAGDIEAMRAAEAEYRDMIAQ